MSDAPEPFPWDEVMALALGILRWTPETVWRATPREFAAALRGPAGSPVQPATSGDIERLMRAYPDAVPTSPPCHHRACPGDPDDADRRLSDRDGREMPGHDKGMEMTDGG
jgi:uncharacterized phage protein (TIGR02216 family)